MECLVASPRANFIVDCILMCYLQVLRTNAALRAVADLTATSEGKAGLLQGLTKAMKTDPALRAQMHAVMNQQMNRNSSKLYLQEALRR